MAPRVLILHATGTNRDHDAAAAFQLAGAEPEIVPLQELRERRRKWQDYQILVVPGGFSYADALGAGKLFALDLQSYFVDEVKAFVQSGRPVIGICNGFQALVKSGLLPALDGAEATLTFNASGHFECRWVTLRPVSRVCLWTRDLTDEIYCPVAHGEGRFLVASDSALSQLKQRDQVALTYVGNGYPDNPNGSPGDVAGVCNPQGNVLGLMPHPEDHIQPFQHPRWTRGERGKLGLKLLEAGVRHAAAM
ncbi:MAG: phosphoribosylformylglycinamidine synthase I [Myxococcota bacterium]